MALLRHCLQALRAQQGEWLIWDAYPNDPQPLFVESVCRISTEGARPADCTPLHPSVKGGDLNPDSH